MYNHNGKRGKSVAPLRRDTPKKRKSTFETPRPGASKLREVTNQLIESSSRAHSTPRLHEQEDDSASLDDVSRVKQLSQESESEVFEHADLRSEIEDMSSETFLADKAFNDVTRSITDDSTRIESVYEGFGTDYSFDVSQLGRDVIHGESEGWSELKGDERKEEEEKKEEEARKKRKEEEERKRRREEEEERKRKEEERKRKEKEEEKLRKEKKKEEERKKKEEEKKRKEEEERERKEEEKKRKEEEKRRKAEEILRKKEEKLLEKERKRKEKEEEKKKKEEEEERIKNELKLKTETGDISSQKPNILTGMMSKVASFFRRVPQPNLSPPLSSESEHSSSPNVVSTSPQIQPTPMPPMDESPLSCLSPIPVHSDAASPTVVLKKDLEKVDEGKMEPVPIQIDDEEIQPTPMPPMDESPLSCLSPIPVHSDAASPTVVLKKDLEKVDEGKMEPVPIQIDDEEVFMLESKLSREKVGVFSNFGTFLKKIFSSKQKSDTFVEDETEAQKEEEEEEEGVSQKSKNILPSQEEAFNADTKSTRFSLSMSASHLAESIVEYCSIKNIIIWGFSILSIIVLILFISFSFDIFGLGSIISSKNRSQRQQVSKIRGIISDISDIADSMQTLLVTSDNELRLTHYESQNAIENRVLIDILSPIFDENVSTVYSDLFASVDTGEIALEHRIKGISSSLDGLSNMVEVLNRKQIQQDLYLDILRNSQRLSMTSDIPNGKDVILIDILSPIFDENVSTVYSDLFASVDTGEIALEHRIKGISSSLDGLSNMVEVLNRKQIQQDLYLDILRNSQRLSMTSDIPNGKDVSSLAKICDHSQPWYGDSFISAFIPKKTMRTADVSNTVCQNPILGSVFAGEVSKKAGNCVWIDYDLSEMMEIAAFGVEHPSALSLPMSLASSIPSRVNIYSLDTESPELMCSFEYNQYGWLDKCELGRVVSQRKVRFEFEAVDSSSDFLVIYCVRMWQPNV
ncbi:hypothetical protein ADUPG1_012549 [Aduncisulcus paluster]|uniref:SUN domain-containing protein n=1 Tax=Aduncisulcus paluster TaxID=2918883 RepID=A0ABQ5K337_9EUKA|nr:hypothetical protein ADUPG1_012549 [Aduncisulcus paluster]